MRKMHFGDKLFSLNMTALMEDGPLERLMVNLWKYIRKN